MSSLIEKMRELQTKRVAALSDIVGPARAAANQMKDAGMKAGSEPLLEALFKLEAVEQEIEKLVLADPRAMLNEMLDAMRGPKP